MPLPIPHELVEAIAKGDAVLFIGAGLSAGVGLPGWSALLTPLADEIELPLNRRGDLLLVAQYCQNKLGRQRLIESILTATDTTGKEITSNHRRLVKLGGKAWITTNYDDLLERTLREAGVSPRVVVQDTSLSFTGGDAVTLLKVHGDRSQPESIVITKADYETIALRQPLLQGKLKTLLAEKTFLFLGYSLGDPDFSLALAEVGQHLGEYRRMAYAVLFDADEFTVGELDRQHIKALALTTDGQPIHSQLLGEFLDELIPQVQASTGVQPPSVPAIPGPAAMQALGDYLDRAVARYERRQAQALLSRERPTEPYRGLLPFELEDRSIFFGRDAAIAGLYTTVLKDRLTVVQARSGAGKTSLLNAGLSPRLIEEGRLPVYARPYEDPALAIKRSLASPADEPWPEGLAALPLPEFLGMVCARLSRETRELVLVLDQFEEFFVFWPQAEQRHPFVEALAECYHDRALPLRIVLSIRKDYFGDLQELQPQLPVFQNVYRVEPMTRSEMEEAITGPTKALGKPARYQPELLAALLDDLGRGGMELPHLQIICSRLYETLPDGETAITLGSYEAQGGAHGILGRYLQDVLEQLPGDGADAARRALKVLISSEGMRSVQSQAALAAMIGADAATLTPILDALVRARVVQCEEADGEVRYQLAHEYLIPEIGTWLDTSDRATKQAQELLQRQLISWRQNKELLIPEKALRIIHHQRESMPALKPEELELLLRSALATGFEAPYWSGRAKEGGVAMEEIAAEGLKSTNFRTRAGMVKALAELGDAFAESIVGLLLDEYPQVRAAAIQAMERLQPDGAWRQHLRYECYIPAGKFIMGDEQGDTSEAPAHRVYLNAFYIGKYPVTEAEYGRYQQDKGHPVAIDIDKEQHPAVRLSWYDAQAYATWAGMRLITEAEWEKAASWQETVGAGWQGRKRKYPWGNRFAKRRCNTSESGIETTTPVGAYSKEDGDSFYGVADMAGNVWEWTSSQDKKYPYDPTDGREDLTDAKWRVLRGGCFRDYQWKARCAHRVGEAAKNSHEIIGFRVGVSPDL
jgi:hypothetical protein